MMSRRSRSARSIGVAALLFCTAVAPPQPRESPLDAVLAADARVAAIAFRINNANVDRCPRPGLDAGMVLQSAVQYPANVRAAAMERFGLGSAVGVAVVLPDSPAEAAGLKPGDAILAVAGSPAPSIDPKRRDTSYSEVERTLDRIEVAARGRKAVPLDISRNGARRRLTMPVRPGCTIRAQIVPSDELNAFADDRYATITTRLEAFAASDDELALFLGHELAHAYLGHERTLDAAAPMRAILGRAGVPAALVLRTEREADRLGMILAARAGYDVSRAGASWQRLATATGGAGFGRLHPGAAERVREADRLAAEIKAGTVR